MSWRSGVWSLAGWQSDLFAHKDPADRLIAATAIAHRASLISADDKLHGLPGLTVIWD